MTKVYIDGQEFVRAGSHSAGGIGIAISTHNRPAELKNAIERHQAHLPPGALIIVVDDGSSPPAAVPDGVALIRHDVSRGIVASKNASLKYLMDAGCRELFLWDDDAYPIANDWHAPYMASPEAHLSYQFLDLAGPHKLKDLAVVHNDGVHIAYTGQRGVMLYYKRHAIEAVGGFDWIYGRGMYEHSDLAMRIYHAGLNTWAFADVVGSAALIHSMDEHVQVNRTVAPADRQELVARNVKIHNARRDSGYAGYVDLVKQNDDHNVVLTYLLTSSPDPQRGNRMTPAPALLDQWARSIDGAEPVVLADELAEAPAGATLHKVSPAAGNLYFLRWLHVYRWLRENDDGLKFVFATDGTDVEMLREPWGEMQPGKLYVGSEPKTLADSWINVSHAASHLREFLGANREKVMLNAGIIGGDRETVMAFAHEMIRDYYATASRRFWKTEAPGVEVGDMATFNYVAYTKFADRIVTGPRIHTVFKTEGMGKELAWWRHK